MNAGSGPALERIQSQLQPRFQPFDLDLIKKRTEKFASPSIRTLLGKVPAVNIRPKRARIQIITP